MANIRLANKCSVCSSWNWCGRECRSAREIQRPVADKLERGASDVHGILDSPAYDVTVPPNTDLVVFGDVVMQVSGDALGPGTSGTYRYRNPDQRRAYMKAYMAKKRAKAG